MNNYYFKCSFEVKDNYSDKIYKINNYKEAKKFGAIASMSEIASIASDIFSNYEFELSEDIKKSIISFSKRDDEIYGQLSLIPKKDGDISSKSISFIKKQFKDIDNKIRVHNFLLKDSNGIIKNKSYEVYMIIDNRLEEKLWKQ